ncbi:hypothetical protein G9A89_015454 [Geosiphon pyriformis]|nr:hypothetical protein G9A89_015454 [Geosiphon pyriformis]
MESKLKGKIQLWLTSKFDGVQVFTSGLDSGYLGVGIVIIMNSFLAKHVYKISKVPGQLLSIKLLFKNKLLVSILELYTGASLVVQFAQADKINSLIARAVNESFFVVFGGDFNEDGSHKCASFKKCLDLGLVNSLVGSEFLKMPTWANSRGIRKTINFVFISPNLVNVLVHHDVLDVSEHFDTDYRTVSVSLGLGGLLNIQGTNENKWINFKCTILDNVIMFADEFFALIRLSDLDAMWGVFKEFDEVFTKNSSRFHKLELLVSRIVKASHKKDGEYFASLIECWNSLDSDRTLVIQSLIASDMNSGQVHSALLGVRKSYHAFKLVKSQCAKEAHIRSAIDKKMESFGVNKNHTIKSVFEHPFHKVVLNHLIVNDELILESDLIKSEVDVIMESWTRKHRVVDNVSDDWCCQYHPLEYVFDEAFSGIMCPISFDELFRIISDLPDGKAVGLLEISNKLWKHWNKLVLDMLLVLLNSCLTGEFVPVLMILKLYEWEGILTNTHLIALIEMTCKIFSKVLSDRISAAYSAFNVFHEDNFLSPIFAIGLVIEDALEKDQELWLAYNSVSWKHLKKIMTDFDLTNGYRVHNSLDQGEVFSSLLWHIFYDPLLCEIATQHILNIASEFFQINDISINNDKTVVILINSKISSLSLSISGSPIFIAKKKKSHWYLGIFFSTKGLSKPSLAKVHSDIQFFVNLVLKKAVSNKQYLYLVLAVLQPIDALVCRDLKLKSGLLLNFLNDTLHHPFFYGLKSFLQVQSEYKIASLVSFVNSVGILGCLFSHRSHDLQVWYWCPVHSLNLSVCICVSISNNFLAGMVQILLDCNLSLGGSLANSFQSCGSMFMSAILGKSKFSRFFSSLQKYSVAFVDQLCDHHGTRLDSHGPILEWFKLAMAFLDGVNFFFAGPLVLGSAVFMNILESGDFVSIHDCLSHVGSSEISIYTDESLRNLSTAGCRAGAAAFFENIGMGLGIGVTGLMLSTLAELQAITLALECLFSDSQSALNACKSELGLIKGHSGVFRNEHADLIADAAFFFVANGNVISGNFRYFVCDIYHSICYTCWEVGSGSKFLADSLLSKIDWSRSSLVWHSDLHMATGFTSRLLARICTYFMKALHHWLSVAVWKCLYNRHYPSVLCLYCGKVETSDHVFFCKVNNSAQFHILDSHVASWRTLSGLSHFSSFSMALYKSFVFNGWFHEAVSIFHDLKIAGLEVVKFVRSFGLAFKDNICNNKFKVATTPDTTTLEYYQSIYIYCKQKFNIPDGIEVVKKSVYQYIENCINNYLFGNYNISKVKSNLYNNLAHYSQLGTEDLNSETLATYFHELNFNIIKYCKKTYPQYSRTIPNTPTLPKTTAKHLQTPEQGTSSKLSLIITPFSASLAQAQTPNSPLNRFARPEDFTSLRSPTRQQEPLQTSSNLLDFLAENQSEHSETAANKENNSKITEEESIDSENKEDKMTTYIAKIPEFNREDIETSPQEWLNQNAARMLRTIPYFLKGTAGEWFENLAAPFNDWNAFKAAFLEQFTDNNISITLCNRFRNIKQEPSESVMTYIGKFNKLLRQIRQLKTNDYYSDAQILDQFIAGLKDKLIKKVHPHVPEDLNSAIQHAKRYKMAMEEANRTKLVNLAIGETSSAAKEKIDQLTKKLQRDQQNRSNQHYSPPQQSYYQLPPPAYYPPRPQYQNNYYQPAPQPIQQQYQQPPTQHYQVSARRLITQNQFTPPN